MNNAQALKTQIADLETKLAAAKPAKKDEIQTKIDKAKAELQKLTVVIDPRSTKETMMITSVAAVKSTSNSYEGLDAFVNDNCEFSEFDIRQTKDPKSPNFGKFHYVTRHKVGESSGVKSQQATFVPVMAMFYLAAIGGQLSSDGDTVEPETFIEWMKSGEDKPLAIESLDFVATAKVELIGTRAGIVIPM